MVRINRAADFCHLDGRYALPGIQPLSNRPLTWLEERNLRWAMKKEDVLGSGYPGKGGADP
eukprot:scaffold6461_cov145-Skeletonema_menzelii.AAC.11